jgi:hypothetical protein
MRQAPSVKVEQAQAVTIVLAIADLSSAHGLVSTVRESCSPRPAQNRDGPLKPTPLS